MHRRLILSLSIFLVGCYEIPRHLPEPVLIERKMLVKIDDGHFGYGFVNGTGTGFLIHQTEKSNYFLTAQHVCDKPKDIDASKYEDAGEGKLKVLNSAFLVVDVKNKGKRYPGKIIYEDISNDLCLFSTKNNKNIKFSLFELDLNKPKIGTRVRYIGAPQGYLTSEFLYNVEGNYSGKFFIENAHREGYSFYITFGTSGGPILNERNYKVIGLVSGFDKTFKNLTWGSNYDKLKQLILWVKTFKN